MSTEPTNTAGPQDDGITKAPGRHYCHPFYGKRFDETRGVPPHCTDVDPETGVCGMCGTDTSSPLRDAIEAVESRLLCFDAGIYEVPHDVEVPDDYQSGMRDAGALLRAALASFGVEVSR